LTWCAARLHEANFGREETANRSATGTIGDPTSVKAKRITRNPLITWRDLRAAPAGGDRGSDGDWDTTHLVAFTDVGVRVNDLL
jgi:hypothetical protein